MRELGLALLLVALSGLPVGVGESRASGQQTSASGAAAPVETQPLCVNVDEVVVTFNALDANGLPVTDLKRGEIRIRDNGVAPRRIVAFDELSNRPLRAGILLDTSESMQPSLPTNKAIEEKFVERLFRQRTDAVFVSSFGFGSEILQSWTEDPAIAVKAIQSAMEPRNAQRGTALFNALFQACSSSFRSVDPTATGNFILLFSDGEDNAGLTSSDEAARACQQRDIEVFAFLPGPSASGASTGPKTLRDLVAKTGGRVFQASESEDAVLHDLRQIESEMRNQYRLVYNPAELKHDGAFHEIELQPPDRVSRVVVRSGYYAPSR